MPTCVHLPCGGIWWKRNQKDLLLFRRGSPPPPPSSLLEKNNIWWFSMSQALMLKPPVKSDHSFNPCQSVWGPEKSRICLVSEISQKTILQMPGSCRCSVSGSEIENLFGCWWTVGCVQSFYVCALQSVQQLSADAALIWCGGSVWARKLQVSDWLPVG